MSQSFSVAGLVATSPRHIITSEGTAITSFRLASMYRKFDRSQNRWVDGETNWYTITAFNQLAINVSESVSKGERVIVTGEMRVREWDNGERSGTSVEIDAESIGHDLSWGTATFLRTVLVRETTPPDDAPAPRLHPISVA